MTQHAPHTRESDKELRSAIGNISIPRMNGDNLAVFLCSHFDNFEQEEDENGWTPDAVAGCEETLTAIVEAVRRVSTPLTPSDEMVEAGAQGLSDYLNRCSVHMSGKTPKFAPHHREYARAVLEAALNLMGGK